MSLLDSFLLDALPLDVWVAGRTDGALGSGTEDDPFDGSTRETATISVDSISKSGSTATVQATNHGLNEGEWVTIAGVTVDLLSAHWKDVYYLGTFAISNVTANSFAYTMGDEPASAQAPGTLTCHRERERFDAVMRAIPANQAVRLGPGVFETKGVHPNINNWMAKAGQKILGSGMDVTVLKLVEAAVDDSPNNYIAITGLSGQNPSSFEASDFTIDCNVAGQPSHRAACGAVGITGSHTRLRRLRAIHFGTQTTRAECFVFAAGGATATQETVDCTIQDCVMELPGHNNARETSGLCIVSLEWSNGQMGYHRACAIRNCFVDLEFRENPVPIASITLADGDGAATVTTQLPHGRSDGDPVRISGAVVNDSTNNSFNGSYTITDVSTYSFKYTPDPAQAANPTGDMWVGKFPSLLVQVTDFSKTGDLGGGRYRVTLTTFRPNFRVPGNKVSVQRIYENPEAPILSTLYNGLFEVVEVDGAYELSYDITSQTPPPELAPGGLYEAFMGTDFHAVGADGGTAAVVEGNRILNCTTGGPYHDTFNSRDQITRNNYYRVILGPFQSLVGASPALSAGLAAALDVGSGVYVVTGTCSGPHHLSAGEIIYISGEGLSAYYGFFVMSTPPPSPTTFKYTLGPTNPGGSTSGYVQRVWGGGRQVLENNIIEVFPAQTRFYPPRGIYMGWHGDSPGSPIRIREALVRHNVIRHVDGLPDAAPLQDYSRGIFVSEVGNLIIEENVVDLDTTPPPIQYMECQTSHFFGNANAAGLLIQGSEIVSGVRANEISSVVEDAEGLAL